MKALLHSLICGLVWSSCAAAFCAEHAKTNSPTEIFAAALNQILDVIDPPTGSIPKTISVNVTILKADGVAKALVGQTVDLAYQAPDKLLVSGQLEGEQLILGRNGQQLWVSEPAKQFAVSGSAGLPLFRSAPNKKDDTKLGPIKLPLPKEQLALLPLLTKVEMQPAETIDGARCYVLHAVPKAEMLTAFNLPNAHLKVWARESDSWPARIAYTDVKGLDVDVSLHGLKLSAPWPAEKWMLNAPKDQKVETTALSHLTRFLSAVRSTSNQKIPPLGPATGERRVVATADKGRLEIIDGTRVLFLKGSPEEMGRQHGILLKKEIRDATEHILYGVGVGSSFMKGKWFFGEIESAQSRLAPFIAKNALAEMDAIALASGLEKEEVRLANFFPELFHCSGFALLGEATVGGRMYHGRILDYMRGVGLEQNAVVIVVQPDGKNAWVNVGYAGFVGSVTALNEKHLAIGEMGGHGEGNWDGKPMAQLVREVMENASSIDEALAIMRKGPRTCEYYYVISDGKSKRAVGVAATPTKFEMILPGASHSQLPHAIKDAVLMSAGDRYETLVQRVQARHGRIDAATARDLMTSPVCMTSNLHSVLFEPETLDFWVANADSQNVASHARYTHYNLVDLLGSDHPDANAKAK